jgi:hypothetical protein
LKPNLSSILQNRWIQVLIILILGILVFANTLDNAWHFDDYRQVANNERLKDFTEFNKIDTWLDINYRPLSRFTFAFSHQFDGSLSGFHWFNVLLHGLSAVLVLSLNFR